MSSQNVIADNCDFGVCVDECLRIGQNSTVPTLLDGTLTVTNCKGSYLSEDPARGFVVLREQTPKNIVINNNNIDGTITCISKLPASVAQLNVDLSDNFWGEETPDFSTVLVGFDDVGITETITPAEYYVSETLETLNTDCTYVGHHTYADNWYTVSEPTCYSTGSQRRDCTNERCDDETAFELRDTAATGIHSYSQDYTVVTAPTCVSAGEERAACTLPGCTAYLSREIAINPDAHNMGEWTLYIAPTCTIEGLNRRLCTNDGCEYYEDAPVAVTAHSYTVLTQVITEPTCCKAGTAIYRCATCELTDTLPYSAPTGNHTWSEWTVTRPAGVNEEGLRIRTCTNEDCTASETEVIRKTGIPGILDMVLSFFRAVTEFVRSIFTILGR